MYIPAAVGTLAASGPAAIFVHGTGTHEEL
jgi:hypothetical protein